MMQQRKAFKIKGHESFTVREGWLQKGLSAVSADPFVFSLYAGADALGVGTNMAKSIRYWLRAFELTIEQSKRGVILSKLGQFLYEKDPYLEHPATLWLLHGTLVCNETLATAWYLFFNRIHVNQMTKEQLEERMEYEMNRYTGGENFSVKSLKDDCSAILHMYVTNQERDYDPEEKTRSPFGELGLLELEGNQIVCKSPSPLSLPVLVVCYLLMKQAEGERYLPMDEAMEGSCGPGRVFYMNRAMLYEYLLTMQNKGLLTINRTAGLDMIYFPQTVTEEMEFAVLEQLYR